MSGKPKITSSDRETARQLIAAVAGKDAEAVARVLAFVRETTVSVAVVAAERERAREAAGHAAWCRTDGCDGTCRDVEEVPGTECQRCGFVRCACLGGKKTTGRRRA